jgi:hypothetical protein
MSPRWGSTPRQTDWLTVSRNMTLTLTEPVTVAEWSKAWTVLARLDAGIVGSHPTRGMDVYVHVYVYSMFVLS